MLTLVLEVDAGEQYKYCIFDSVKHLYVWEESGPMHFWPTSAAVHEFEAQQAAGFSLRCSWCYVTAVVLLLKELGARRFKSNECANGKPVTF